MPFWELPARGMTASRIFSGRRSARSEGGVAGAGGGGVPAVAGLFSGEAGVSFTGIVTLLKIPCESSRHYFSRQKVGAGALILMLLIMLMILIESPRREGAAANG